MAKARSPSYPSIGLKEAVERVGAIYKKDYQNKIPRPVVAAHMGYASLSGRALGVLSSLGKFGLLEGRAEENWVSDLAVAILAHPPRDPARIEALIKAAAMPELFAELDVRFQNGKASDQGIKSWLLMQKFIPAAADAAIRSYRETKQLVEEESEGYYGSKATQEPPVVEMQAIDPVQKSGPVNADKPEYRVGTNFFHDQVPAGMRREVITLDEGDVVITFPDGLSAESFDDLKDHLDLFIKKMQRRAKGPQKGESAN